MKPKRARRFRQGFVLASIALGVLAACNWDPRRPFDREAPEVNEAIGYLDAGEAGSKEASEILQDYLATGKCDDGNIGTPPRVRARPLGSFDLGIALFRIAESYGRRFGEEENAKGQHDTQPQGQRAGSVACALRIVRTVAEDLSQPLELRARARYLEGNLLFLNADYEEAVKAYDKALELAPGMFDAGPFAASDSGRTYAVDPIGRDAAYNRAIALRRADDKKDAGNDASSDASSDASNEGGGGDGGGNDGGGEAGADGGKPESQPNEPPPPPKANQDERMLDQLENAPTVQHEDARKRSLRHRVQGAADR